MYMQIVNFQLKDISEDAYRAMCDQLAPTFAALPGLISKVWLADRATNTYGGIYSWETREAGERFKQSDLFQAVKTNPHLSAITLKEFGILDGPTAVTSGLLARVSR